MQLGDIEMGAEVLGGSPESPTDIVGAPERMVASVMHALQRGQIGAATGVFDAIDEDRGYIAAGRALLAAVSGQPDDAHAAAARVTAGPHTYLDLVYGRIAEALAHVHAGAIDEARATLAEAIEATDATGDRIAQAVVRLTDAAIAEAAGRDDARTARRVAEERLSALGITAEGWRALLSDALGVGAGV